MQFESLGYNNPVVLIYTKDEERSSMHVVTESTFVRQLSI